MLKASNEILIKVDKKLFDRIVLTEKYPSKWNTTLTKLLHKEGDKEEPSSCSGIPLASNLGKLFKSILTTKLNQFLETKKSIRSEQGGFRKGFRTSDHIFTLQTIGGKYIKNGSKMFACFVDLKKAFDSVWRQGLLHKMKCLGLGKKVVNLVSGMYRYTCTSIIHNDKILPKILTNKGVKQGDNLSPPFFNIYINDLPEAIEVGKTDPVTLMDTNINCLMWADDIILMSEKVEGLQQCINNLEKYCMKWKLEINIKKIEVLIFNKTGAKMKSIRFYLGKKLLENVNQYIYLGFRIAASGTFKHGIQSLIDKAKRAWFSIQSMLIKSTQKNTDTYTTLFDNVVKPILLYSNEIWGTDIKLGGRGRKFFQLASREIPYSSVQTYYRNTQKSYSCRNWKISNKVRNSAFFRTTKQQQRFMYMGSNNEGNTKAKRVTIYF